MGREFWNYQVKETVIGAATMWPRTVFTITCMMDCECPNCPDGTHRVDAFNRGSHRGWYDTRHEAEAVATTLMR